MGALVAAASETMRMIWLRVVSSPTRVASQRMNAYFDEGKIRMSEAVENVQTVYYPVDEADSSLIGMVYLETDTMRMFLSPERKLEKIWTSKSDGTLYPMTQIPDSKDYLPNFGWYDYIRPLDKDDIYYVEEKHQMRRGNMASTRKRQ